ncbi:MAG: hypothetical protein EBS05_10520 [Proteobacteria bacterium]|nr:hypothetical protein [Pseudomonadota bacterium]
MSEGLTTRNCVNGVMVGKGRDSRSLDDAQVIASDAFFASHAPGFVPPLTLTLSPLRGEGIAQHGFLRTASPALLLHWMRFSLFQRPRAGVKENGFEVGKPFFAF